MCLDVVLSIALFCLGDFTRQSEAPGQDDLSMEGVYNSDRTLLLFALTI